MQSFNIFALFLILCVILQEKPPIPSWSFLLLSIALLFGNGIRYYRISFSLLQEKWDTLAEKKKNILNGLVPAYITGSIIVWLILLIYVVNKKY
jgi:hypothetical protein